MYQNSSKFYSIEIHESNKTLEANLFSCRLCKTDIQRLGFKVNYNNNKRN